MSDLILGVKNFVLGATAVVTATVPTIQLTYPINGTTVIPGSQEVLQANASSGAGVNRVIFHVNGKHTCTDYTSPYTCIMTVPAASGASYTVTAWVIDKLGRKASSSATINKQNVVTRSGEYSYSGYTLKYTLNIPKNGGDITGSFDGVCKGPIVGKYDGKEGGTVSGEAQANCKVAIFSYDLKAKYSGKLYLKEGKVDINWEGQIPYTNNSGSFTIFFEPVN